MVGTTALTPPPVPKKRTVSTNTPATGEDASPTPRRRERKRGCGFGSVLLTLVLILGGGAAWFFTQQFRLERAAFERVRHSNSVDEIEQFLTTRMYMPEEHRRYAEARIARLQSDSADYMNATTVERCEHYLTAHADGRHVDEVQARLNRLRRTRPSIPQEPDSLPARGTTTAPATFAAPSNKDESETPEHTPAATSGSARYHVIAASFANYDTATLRAAELRGKGYSAYVMEAQTNEGRVYRVVVASYSDAASAQRTVAALRRDCPDAWVMAK